MAKKMRWSKFDFDDFCGDINLQSCPLDTQGFYMHLLRLMSRASPPGYLAHRGEHVPRVTLARLLPYHWQTIEHHIRILQSNGVLKQDENGLWYNKRMYEDWLEYAKYQQYGKEGGRPKKEKGGVSETPNPELEEELEEEKEKELYSPFFEKFWDVYPRKINKSKALKVWDTRMKERIPSAKLISAASNYAIYTKDKEKQFVQHPATFLGPSKAYEDFIDGYPDEEVEDDPEAIREQIRQARERVRRNKSDESGGSPKKPPY